MRENITKCPICSYNLNNVNKLNYNEWAVFIQYTQLCPNCNTILDVHNSKDKGYLTGFGANCSGFLRDGGFYGLDVCYHKPHEKCNKCWDSETTKYYEDKIKVTSDNYRTFIFCGDNSSKCNDCCQSFPICTGARIDYKINLVNQLFDIIKIIVKKYNIKYVDTHYFKEYNKTLLDIQFITDNAIKNKNNDELANIGRYLQMIYDNLKNKYSEI